MEPEGCSPVHTLCVHQFHPGPATQGPRVTLWVPLNFHLRLLILGICSLRSTLETSQGCVFMRGVLVAVPSCGRERMQGDNGANGNGMGHWEQEAEDQGAIRKHSLALWYQVLHDGWS